MSLRSIVVAAFAATALSGVAFADDYYHCGEHLCHDDQADETRRLNEMQLDNPGAGIDAVPPPDHEEYDPDAYDAQTPYDQTPDNGGDMNGQGGPYDPDEGYGAPPDDQSGEEGCHDGRDSPPDECCFDGAPEDCDPADCDPDMAPGPYEQD